MQKSIEAKEDKLKKPTKCGFFNFNSENSCKRRGILKMPIQKPLTIVQNYLTYKEFLIGRL
jgi:hypothetical protein